MSGLQRMLLVFVAEKRAACRLVDIMKEGENKLSAWAKSEDLRNGCIITQIFTKKCSHEMNTTSINHLKRLITYLTV